jgi:hypothetical protein
MLHESDPERSIEAMKLTTMALFLVLASALAGNALAQGTSEISVSGTVVSSDENLLVIRTDAGQEMTFDVEPSTLTVNRPPAGQRIEVKYEVDNGRNRLVRIVTDGAGSTGGSGARTSDLGTTTNARDSAGRDMPATASPLALIALGGIAALGSGTALRVFLKG